MNKKITLLKGDGIGPEIVDEAVKILRAVGEKFGHTFEFTESDIGGCSIDKYGVPITDEAIDLCKKSDSVLMGSVGGPKWDNIEVSIRPEKALLKIRKELGVFANLRPTKLFPCLKEASPLKNIDEKNPIDFMIVRELTGGIYFGRHETGVKNGEEYAEDVMTYTESEIERIARVGFETAMKRRKKLASVDKANILDTSRLWRKVLHRVKDDYPEVEYTDILVDNAAMQLIRDPYQFDVIVTENTFGDILSDEASMLTGSIGMMPSASLSDSSLGLYEPIHGSAPDIVGMGMANPIATILSASMMLRFSFGMEKEADAIENSVNKVIESGFRTRDIMSGGSKLVSCTQMGDLIKQSL